MRVRGRACGVGMTKIAVRGEEGRDEQGGRENKGNEGGGPCFYRRALPS